MLGRQVKKIDHEIQPPDPDVSGLECNHRLHSPADRANEDGSGKVA